jgi:uncharacterized membrane protein YfcA
VAPARSAPTTGNPSPSTNRVAAAFFGIGGGFLIVPGLMLATGMTLASAAASSLVSVALFGAATALNYALSSLVDWRVARLFIWGA